MPGRLNRCLFRKSEPTPAPALARGCVDVVLTAVAAGEEDQAFEQMHVLLVLQQRTV